MDSHDITGTLRLLHLFLIHCHFLFLSLCALFARLDKKGDGEIFSFRYGSKPFMHFFYVEVN